MKRPPIDPELLRDRLAEAQGKRYWQSIEELAEDPRLHEMIQREFPQDASVWTDPVSRRRFLSLMGASLALAGFAGTGCRPPTGKIMPYVKQPENLIPGKPLYYATASTEGGFLTGLLVESHEGRPTKIEGNPLHVASRGATTVHQQASILGMYDPDRSHSVVFREQFRAWVDVLEELRGRLNSRPGGKGVAILGEVIGSPTLLAQKEAFLKAYPQAQWFTFDPLNRDNAVAGAKLAFDKPYHNYYKLFAADVLVSLQSDFLNEGPGCLAYARQFADRRRDGGTERPMNRLYAFETDLTVTGSRADHRFAVRPSQMEAIIWNLAFKVGVQGLQEKNLPTLDKAMKTYVDAVAKDLTRKESNDRAKGTTAVLAGEALSPAAHAMVHAINEFLGNFNKTVFFTEPLPGFQQNSMESLDNLIKVIENGSVDTLIILGGNPAYTAPTDLSFASTLQASLKKPREKWLSVRLGDYYDETSRLCHWHVPQSHYLEQWGDGIAYDGAACLVQPLIAPLYASRSLHEFLGELTPVDPKAPTYETQSIDQVVQAYWKKHLPKSVEGSFEDYWQKSLHDGILLGTRPATLTPKLTAAFKENINKNTLKPTPAVELGEKSYELLFTLDPAVVDGRYANNGWLQEWPKPTTRISWDNALYMSQATAAKLKLIQHPDQRRGGEHGNSVVGMVRIKGEKRTLDEVPIWIVPGHADGAVTLQLGYGRDRAGKVGSKVGVNAYRLRSSSAPWTQVVDITPLSGKTHNIACQQGHHSMEGRDIVRSGTAEEYRKEPNFIHKHAHGAHATKPLPTLYDGKDHPYDGYKWGMAVNLSTCTGCGACVVACQAENNIPVVGKTEVMRGREMHWLRIDRYFETAADHGHGHGKEKDSKATEHAAPLHVHYQPLMCQHCENAPCELVCPVEATAHGDEGTNDMVYNRCVGTRYCANNCPYKVRRFNFLQYTDYHTPSLRLMYNPDVTVRTRGVMEKCTFCIQRISYARIEAAKEALDGNPERVDPHKRKVQGKDVAYIKDGEVVTACQASCPTEAIIFGDLNDPDSKVAKLAKSPLRYDLLGELGVNPRTFYLASIRNPNPALETK